MKYIILIGDGMADNPVPELGGKTPLEYARIPTMDTLAREGELGTLLTVPKGVAPGSDTAILSIFGYDPRLCFSGRSPLEAAGSGVSLAAGDVSYRCNMVALEDGQGLAFEDKRILSHNGGSIDGESSIALLRALLANEEFAACARENHVVFHESPSFRHIAVQKGVKLDGFTAHGPHDHLGKKLGAWLPKGSPAAPGLVQLMRLANKLLAQHPINTARKAQGLLPANGIWFWAEGTAIALPGFEERHGKKGLVVSAVPLVKGIGALAGLEYVNVEGATGELDTNYEGKTRAVLAGLAAGKDFALLHIEAPDECTHNGDTAGKVKAIENIDQRSLALLLAGLEEMNVDYRLAILSDHKTLTSTRGHDGDPVPYILYDSRRPCRGSGLGYSEKNAQAGPYNPVGHSFVDKLFANE